VQASFLHFTPSVWWSSCLWVLFLFSLVNLTIACSNDPYRSIFWTLQHEKGALYHWQLYPACFPSYVHGSTELLCHVHRPTVARHRVIYGLGRRPSAVVRFHRLDDAACRSAASGLDQILPLKLWSGVSSSSLILSIISDISNIAQLGIAITGLSVG